MNKLELKEKYGDLGYNEDNTDGSNLVNIGFTNLRNSNRLELLEELINESQHTDMVSLVADKYLECTRNKERLKEVEGFIRGK